MHQFDRQENKNKELEILAEEAKLHPELFEQHSYVEDAAMLKRFGIAIPGKEYFPQGYLKLWPEDFIVEEINLEGTVTTVVQENTLEEATLQESAPTIFATLVKCGLSTIEVIEDIAQQIGCDPKTIGYAGIKDRDALTAQRLSFRKISLQKLKQVHSPYFFLKDIEVGKGVVSMGQLRGNRFTLLIRTDRSFLSKTTFDVFTKQLTSVREHGFYNFFYLQRFGTPRLLNYQWGLALLQGNYEKVVLDTFIAPGERELPYFKNLRSQCQAIFGQWEKIESLLSPFPIIFRHELKLVRYLKQHPDDYSGALSQISDQIVLWTYALASLYFNELLSHSIAQGTTPATLPLFLGFQKRNWLPYETLLKRDGIFPPPFENLQVFPFLQIRERVLPTSDQPNILQAKVVPEGLVLSFELGKGQYATTFLSHLFNLVSGKPPEFLSPERVDTKKILGNGSLEHTLSTFASVIRSKTETEKEPFGSEG